MTGPQLDPTPDADPSSSSDYLERPLFDEMIEKLPAVIDAANAAYWVGKRAPRNDPRPAWEIRAERQPITQLVHYMMVVTADPTMTEAKLYGRDEVAFRLRAAYGIHGPTAPQVLPDLTGLDGPQRRALNARLTAAGAKL